MFSKKNETSPTDLDLITIAEIKVDELFFK
jgi:hypothetical protein